MNLHTLKKKLKDLGWEQSEGAVSEYSGYKYFRKNNSTLEVEYLKVSPFEILLVIYRSKKDVVIGKPTFIITEGKEEFFIQKLVKIED